MQQDVTCLQSDNDTLKGVIHKCSQKLKHLNDRVAMLTAKSMENNITITNLEGDKDKEKCKENVITFLRNKVEIDVDEN